MNREPCTHGQTCPCPTCQAELADEHAADSSLNTPHRSGLTCIHAKVGLCPSCREEYDTDPLAWLEYGQHPHKIPRRPRHGTASRSEQPHPFAQRRA